jgi:hypothetical protein
MSSTEAERAQLEARREVEAHPERKLRHESAIGRYLASVAYGQTRPERARRGPIEAVEQG